MPTDSIVHRGVLNPACDEYYYTLSDRQFKNFKVRVVKKSNGIWLEPSDAFFNTKHSEHGMSFSPDGKTIYFSSTRPHFAGDSSNLWRIWRTHLADSTWSVPDLIEFTGLDKPLQSHPTIDEHGHLFFHASNRDYTDMNVYQTRQLNNEFSRPTLVGEKNVNKCTPCVSADGSLLFYAVISNPMELVFSRKQKDGFWPESTKIESNLKDIRHQGNPFLTSDGRFLFFATEQIKDPGNWNIYWMPFSE